MIIDDLFVTLIHHGASDDLHMSIGTMEDGIAVDRRFAVVGWFSSPSMWTPETLDSISLVPLNELEAYLADAGPYAKELVA